MLIFDSIVTDFVLMKYMTLDKRVDKSFVYEWCLTYVLWHVYVKFVDSVIFNIHNFNTAKTI